MWLITFKISSLINGIKPLALILITLDILKILIPISSSLLYKATTSLILTYFVGITVGLITTSRTSPIVS